MVASPGFLTAEVHDWPNAVRCAAGMILFRERDLVEGVWLIKSGVVKICIAYRGDQVIVAIRAQNWILGAPAVDLGDCHLGTATTLTDCELQTMSLRQFRMLLDTAPEWGKWVRAQYAREIREQLQRASAFATGRVCDRLDWLVPVLFRASCISLADGSLRLGFPLSTTEIADMLCVSRQAASTHLNRAAGRGRVARNRGWLVIPPASPLRSALLRS